MLSEFLNFIKENNLVEKKERILAAVSGGIDSMVMADLFIRSGMDIGIAHCNFCLRGTESDKDETLVKRLASKNRIPFYSVRFETRSWAKENGISVQMAARDLRYRWFEDIRQEYDYGVIAVAHNLNDNIETMLINLTRGTGIAGLTGMKPSVNHIIRPLLFASRHSIEDYCRKNRIRFREDQSNLETKYTRNKIRHLVIPVLKEINPSVETTLNDTAGRFGEVNDILGMFIGDLSRRIIFMLDNILKINIKDLKPFLTNGTVIFELFKPFGITGNNMGDLRSVISGRTGSHILTATHRILKNRGEILITKLAHPEGLIFTAGTVKEMKDSAVFRSVKLMTVSGKFKIVKDPAVACLDYDKIKFPLILRNWHHGDYFYPFGMKERKKLSDYLVDRKFSIPEKEKLMILESDGRIAWLAGERTDDRFKVTRLTKKVLVITI